MIKVMQDSYVMVKKDIEIQPGFKPGLPLNSGQMLLSTEPLELDTQPLALERRIDGIYP